MTDMKELHGERVSFNYHGYKIVIHVLRNNVEVFDGDQSMCDFSTVEGAIEYINKLTTRIFAV